MSASSASPSLSRTAWGEWAMGLIIAGVALLIATAVWGYAHWTDQQARQQARKAWVAVPKVLSQLSDGRMVQVKVNLKLDDGAPTAPLDGHGPALSAMIQAIGPTLSRDDLRGPEGMDRYATAIRDSLNSYLSGRQMDERVADVAFEEFVLMP